MPAHDKDAPEEEKKAAAATNKELRAASTKDFKAADTNHDGRPVLRLVPVGTLVYGKGGY